VELLFSQNCEIRGISAIYSAAFYVRLTVNFCCSYSYVNTRRLIMSWLLESGKL